MRSVLKVFTAAALIGLGSGALHAQQPAPPAPAEEPQRQLGAHAHGQGKLSIAIEKRTVEIELEAPGSDIVGFEHEAKTAEQKAAMAKARATLTKPSAVFKLVDAAGCRQTSAKVKVVGGQDHDHGHGHSAAKKGAKQAEAAHSEFHVEYTLTCTKPELLVAIDTEYFALFPAAQSLEVSLIGPSTQTKQTITRDKPRIDLKAAM